MQTKLQQAATTEFKIDVRVTNIYYLLSNENKKSNQET